jgi:hypothetical protein
MLTESGVTLIEIKPHSRPRVPVQADYPADLKSRM